MIFLQDLGPGTPTGDDEGAKQDRHVCVETEKLRAAALGYQMEKSQHPGNSVGFL